MEKILVSLSGFPGKQKVSSEDVKSAKSILKTASKQQNRESKDTYKEVTKQLEILRRKKDKDVGKISKKVETLQAKQSRLENSFDSRIEKLTSRRDKVAAKAGIITATPSPRANVTDAKRPTVSSKPKQSDATKSHNVKLSSKHKVAEAPDETDDETGDDSGRDSTPKVPKRIKAKSKSN